MGKKYRKILHISGILHNIIEDLVYLRKQKDSIEDMIMIGSNDFAKIARIIDSYDIVLFHFINDLDKIFIRKILDNFYEKKIGLFFHTYYPFYEDGTGLKEELTHDKYWLFFINNLDFVIVQDSYSKNFINNYILKNKLNNKSVYLLNQYINSNNVFSNKVKSNTFRVGFIGSFSFIKGFDLIKNILKKNNFLSNLDIDLILYTIKNTKDDIYIEENISNQKTHKNIKIVFNEYDRKKIYSNIDCLIISSVWNETGPMVLYEAFINKIPVIVSNKKSLIEKVIDRSDSYIFNSGDARDLLKGILWMNKNYKKLILNNKGYSYNKIEDYNNELTTFFDEL